MINRDVYFDKVRQKPFGGSMTQEQVDGQNVLLDRWGSLDLSEDRRWLAYCLATTMHETASTMQPIEEYGKGAGHPYGIEDSETKQTYYGRGFVQLTWRENYSYATHELGLQGSNDLEWHAGKALEPWIAADVLFYGMVEGWFRRPHCLGMYFSDSVSDPYNAREIVNGDKSVVPSWASESIGKIIEGYYNGFLSALNAASTEDTSGPEGGGEEEVAEVTVTITTSGPVKVKVIENG